MPINDPKTPFHEENSDEEMGNDVLEEEGQIDPEVKQHLDEAERNKQANAAINSGVRR